MAEVIGNKISVNFFFENSFLQAVYILVSNATIDVLNESFPVYIQFHFNFSVFNLFSRASRAVGSAAHNGFLHQCARPRRMRKNFSKISFFIAAYYAKGVFSSFQQMEKMFQKLQNDTLQGADQSARGMVSMVRPTLQVIDGYGCWCYFGAEHGQGRGHPVNEVDSLCQWLHHGYRAMI